MALVESDERLRPHHPASDLYPRNQLFRQNRAAGAVAVVDRDLLDASGEQTLGGGVYFAGEQPLTLRAVVDAPRLGRVLAVAGIPIIDSGDTFHVGDHVHRLQLHGGLILRCLGLAGRSTLCGRHTY